MYSFDIYENSEGKVTHAILTDHHGAQRLYPYRRDDKSGGYRNVSGQVTKRTLARDDKREEWERLYKWA